MDLFIHGSSYRYTNSTFLYGRWALVLSPSLYKNVSFNIAMNFYEIGTSTVRTFDIGQNLGFTITVSVLMICYLWVTVIMLKMDK